MNQPPDDTDKPAVPTSPDVAEAVPTSPDVDQTSAASPDAAERPVPSPDVAQPTPAQRQREARLAAALRENLRRRKAQSRGRSAAAPGIPDPQDGA